MFGKLRIPAIAAIAALSALAFSFPAAAQSTTPGQQAPAAQPTVTEEQIESFVVAARELGEINARYSPQLEQTEDTAKQEQIRREASGNMVEAIREAGLTVEEYNQIYTLTRTDPDVADKVKQKLDAPQ